MDFPNTSLQGRLRGFSHVIAERSGPSGLCRSVRAVSISSSSGCPQGGPGAPPPSAGGGQLPESRPGPPAAERERVPVARAAQEVATGSLLRDWSKGGGEAPRKKVAAFKVGLFACQMGSL